MLVQHFMQHYEMLIDSLLVWRTVPDWTDHERLPDYCRPGSDLLNGQSAIVTPMTKTHYDVVIIGGGLAGLSLARQLLLSSDSLTILQFDKRLTVPQAGQKVGEATVQVSGYYFSKVLALEEYLLREHYPEVQPAVLLEDRRHGQQPVREHQPVVHPGAVERPELSAEPECDRRRTAAAQHRGVRSVHVSEPRAVSRGRAVGGRRFAPRVVHRGRRAPQRDRPLGGGRGGPCPRAPEEARARAEEHDSTTAPPSCGSKAC